MEIRHLEEFIELARSLNFTETATDLHLTQPTLSKHMATLEKDLKSKLFERSHSKIELTEEGFYFLGIATDIVDQYVEAKNTISLMKSRQPIRIDGRFEDPIISSLISLVFSLNQNARCQPIIFNHSRNKSSLFLLIDEDIDVFIDMPPTSEPDQFNLATQTLFSRPFVAIIDKDHPLAEKEAISIADLKGSVLIHLLWENYQAGWDKIVYLCEQRGFTPKEKTVPVRSLAEGITALPKGSVLIYPGASKELKYMEKSPLKACLPVVDEDAVFTTCVVYKKDNAEKLSVFLEILEEAMNLIQNK